MKIDEEIKEALWKVFCVASFLFITIFFILPYLVQTSTYFHEKAHQKALLSYGVKSSYSVNLLETIPGFFNPTVNKLGVTRFNMEEYLRLDKYQRTSVNISGIISDLRFLFLIGIYLSFVNVYIYYKLKFQQDINFSWVLAIDWILFMWLLALVQITISNVTFRVGDVYRLIDFLRV